MEQDVAQNSAGRDESEPQKRNGNEGPLSHASVGEDEQLRGRLERLSAMLDSQAKAEASSRNDRVGGNEKYQWDRSGSDTRHAGFKRVSGGGPDWRPHRLGD